ncbi:VOC family protein [Pseudorhodoplanes sinuspersici]|nr:VOC family protein [Pseudorhodoplanes sinuspersici]RKE74230.1 catechol-2,3-dioxygenase [Pseudorhodoplanes sinuspersici]
MPRLRHFAICVSDLDKSAKFYGDVFGMKRHGREDLSIGSAVYMGDGTINLALLNFVGTEGHDFGDKAEGQIGPNHFGFQVDSMKETQALIEQNGGRFFFDLGDERKGNFERKFKDPEGIIFDISENGWVGTDGRKIKSDPAHAFLDEVLVTPEALSGRIKHFALTVKQLEKQSEFYQTVFGLKFLGYDHQPMGSAIYLSDGVTNLALIHPNKPENEIVSGPNHCGFQVTDLKATEGKIDSAGGKFFFDFGDAKHGNFERKFKDHDGVVFDISKHGWTGTDSYIEQKHEDEKTLAPAK